jgi:hypothetical protein
VDEGGAGDRSLVRLGLRGGGNTEGSVRSGAGSRSRVRGERPGRASGGAEGRDGGGR